MKLSEYRALKANKKKNKFGAVACNRDGIRFHSKLERAYYDHLLLLRNAGKIKYFLRQVPLHLPGNIRYVIDFVVFWNIIDLEGDEVDYIDVKGKSTQVYLNKKKTAEAVYPITIREVKKGDF